MIRGYVSSWTPRCGGDGLGNYTCSNSKSCRALKPEYMEKRKAAKVRRATGVRATDEFLYLPKLAKSMLRRPCGRYVIVERNMRSE